MKYTIHIATALVLTLATGCRAPFVDVGLGYNRFNMEPIRSTVTVNSTPVETKLTHVDAFVGKIRSGGQIVEAVPQLRAGVEIRTALGGSRDTERLDNARVYSQITLLLFGAGPFVAWQQPLGKYLFVEGGGFFGGYTVGVYEKGRRSRYGYSYDVDDEGGVGWGGGIYGKIGTQNMDGNPFRFSLETGYERGEWDFGDDVGTTDVDSYSFLISSEVDF